MKLRDAIKAGEAVMIWTKDGVYLQTDCAEGFRLSGMGKHSLASVERFCAEHNIDLLIDQIDKRKEIRCNLAARPW